jgi:hypothetical protein
LFNLLNNTAIAAIVEFATAIPVVVAQAPGCGRAVEAGAWGRTLQG